MLVTVKSPAQRAYFADLVRSQKLSVKALVAMVRKAQEEDKAYPGRMKRYSGLFNLYGLVTRHNHVCLDLYSRFLADVFYHPDKRDPSDILGHGHFLNQELLDHKLAVKYYRY